MASVSVSLRVGTPTSSYAGAASGMCAGDCPRGWPIMFVVSRCDVCECLLHRNLQRQRLAGFRFRNRGTGCMCAWVIDTYRLICDRMRGNNAVNSEGALAIASVHMS